MKMDNKKLTIGAAALTAIIISAGLATISFAHQGDPSTQGPNYAPERHEAMTAAFETKDYDAWKTARGDLGHGRMMDMIDADNFELFTEMREARLAGDTDKANEIRAELGLGQGQMMYGKNGHRGEGRGADRGEARAMRGAGSRGQNVGGNFVDADGDGTCDHM